METKGLILTKFSYIVERKMEKDPKGFERCIYVGKLIIENSPVENDEKYLEYEVYESLESHYMETYGKYRARWFSHDDSIVLAQIYSYINNTFEEVGIKQKWIRAECYNRAISVYKGVPWSVDVFKAVSDERLVEVEVEVEEHIRTCFSRFVIKRFSEALKKSADLGVLKDIFRTTFNAVIDNAIDVAKQNEIELMMKTIEKSSQKK